jgi:hypothetical protein
MIRSKVSVVGYVKHSRAIAHPEMPDAPKMSACLGAILESRML